MRVLMLAVFSFLQLYSNQLWADIGDHVLNARRFGADTADTKVVIRVVDENKMPVSNAAVSVGFYLNKEPGKNPSCEGVTDAHGEYVATHQSVGEITYVIRKEGFYRTRDQINFRNRFDWNGCVKDGKWQPYGKTYTVILKSKKDPIPMIVHAFECRKTKLEEYIGFDLEKGDYVAPYGDGAVTDFVLYITHEKKTPFAFKSTLTLLFTNACDGAYIKQKDKFSTYVSEYRADTNEVFQSKLVFEYNSLDANSKINTILSPDQYIVLRTRTRLDKDGKIKDSHYSKIYGYINGQFEFIKGRVSFESFMNPMSNDLNIESKDETRLLDK